MITHHPQETTLLAYAAGTLEPALAIVTAVHLGACRTCQGTLAALEATGGALLDSLPPEAVGDSALQAALDRLDAPPPQAVPVLHPDLPAPLNRVVLGRWWPVARGVRWRRMQIGGAAFGGLIQAQPHSAFPRHGHAGLELTCVLSGAFTDASGRYEAGDLSEPDDDHDQPPVAAGPHPCLCVVASEGMRLRGTLGRVQRLLGL